MDFSKVKNIAIGGKNVANIAIGNQIVWQMKKEYKPFCIINLDTTPVNVYINKGSNGELQPPRITLEYSMDECKTWTPWATVNNESNGKLSIPVGGKMYLRGDNPNGYGKSQMAHSTRYELYNEFKFDKKVKLDGNIMSLMYKSTYNDKAMFQQKLRDYAFYNLFDGTNLYDVKDLILPCLELGVCSYKQLFYNASITESPVLPALHIGANAYWGLFAYCRQLKKVTCFVLTDITKTHYDSRYGQTLPDYTFDWLSNTMSTGTFIKNKNATWANSGQNYVTNGWTVELADPITY